MSAVQQLGQTRRKMSVRVQYTGCYLLLMLSNVLAGEGSGWTYQPSASTCAGTAADPCGPSYWSKLPNNAQCGGIMQSPVNIAQATFNPTLPGPSYVVQDGGCKTWEQASTNTSFELGFEPGKGYNCENLQLVYKNQMYTLRDMHFHTPSEHTLGGGYFSAEAHMVHQAWNGDVLVLGVFLEESADFIQHSNNTFFQQVWDAGGNQLLSGSAIFVNSSSPLNPYSTLLPSSRAQYVYSGSFTTPPCSEGVQWIVFQYPVMISNSDLSLLRRLTSIESGSPYSLYDGSNNRPTQPISSRTVYWSYGEEATNAIYSPYDLEDADDDMLVFTALAIGGTGLLVALVGLCLIFLVFWSNSYLLSSSSRNRIEKDLPMVSIINPVTDKSTFSTDEGAAHAPV